MRPTTGLSQRGGDVNHLDLVALATLLAQRHRVRDNDAAEFTPVERFDGVAAEDAMRDNGDHFPRAIGHDRIRRFHQRATCVGHVVDEDGDAVLHIAHEDHARHLIRTRALFMDESKSEIEAVGDRGGSVVGSALFRALESRLGSYRCVSRLSDLLPFGTPGVWTDDYRSAHV